MRGGLKVDTSVSFKGRTLKEFGGEEAPGQEKNPSYHFPKVEEHQGKKE